MEYVYAALLIHKAGHKIDENTVKKVLEAAGTKVDEAKVKALVAALDGVNIEEAIKKAAVVPSAVAHAPAAEAKPAAKEEKKEEKKDDSAALAGLGALFG
jgi:large subunit ribosomal protein L12